MQFSLALLQGDVGLHLLFPEFDLLIGTVLLSVGLVSACERKIGRLAASLALAEDSAASKYIIAEMERLDVELGALKREASLAEMESHQAAASAKDAKATAAKIAKLIHGLDGFDDKEKNAIARAVIQECTWDGERLFITL